MGDAPGMRLTDLHDKIRGRLGEIGSNMGGGVGEVVTTALRFWPDRAMAALAIKGEFNNPEIIDAIRVIWAKCREDLEARWGTDKNTAAALDVLIQPVVLELAQMWFTSRRLRSEIRWCIVEANRQRV